MTRLHTLFTALAVFSIMTNLAEAKKMSCGLEGNLKSSNGNRAIKLRIVNRTNQYRTVNWLDYKGKVVFYKALNPGESYTQSTYVGHPWMTTDGPGNCKRIYVPRKSETFNIKR